MFTIFFIEFLIVSWLSLKNFNIFVVVSCNPAPIFANKPPKISLNLENSVANLSPAAAGDRLNTEFSNLKQNFGGLFANIGANIQNFTTRFLKSLKDN